MAFFRFFLFAFFLFAGNQSYTQTPVEVYKLFPGKRQPFILVNFSSRDCINCRSGVSYILPEMAKVVGDSNVVILIDHKNLLLYLKKYPEKFGKFQTQISPDISAKLSPDGRSHLFVISSTKLHSFDLNVLDQKKLNAILDSFETVSKVNPIQSLKKAATQKYILSKRLSYTDLDTIFEQYEQTFEASRGGCLIFSRQFQVGRVIDFNDASSGYFEFGIDVPTIERLNEILSKLYPLKYLPADSSRKVLDYMTLPTTYIENIRIAGEKGYVAFKYNCVSFDGKKDQGDDLGIRSRYFVGEIDLQNKAISSMCNFRNYDAFYLIDTLQKGDKAFNPDLYTCIDVANSQVILRRVPVKTDLTAKLVDSSLYLSASQLNISQQHFYHITDISSSNQLFWRQAGTAALMIWNQSKMNFYTVNGEGYIKKHSALAKLNLSYVYDFYPSDGDMINILGVVGNSECYLIKYRLSDDSILKWKLDNKTLFGNLRFIAPDGFIGYTKDMNTNKIEATAYSLVKAEPEKPIK